MNRPLHVWIAFATCVAVALLAMGFVSLKALGFESENQRARARELLEERVRLALWRMDSSVSPILARENARPYFSWRPLYSPERAYTGMFVEIKGTEVLIPSPLLALDSPWLLLHFQIEPDGTITSPQVPTGNTQDIAETHHVSHERVARFRDRLEAFRERVDAAAIREGLTQVKNCEPLSEGSPPSEEASSDGQTAYVPESQQVRNEMEWIARSGRRGQTPEKSRSLKKGPSLTETSVVEETMESFWTDGTLVIARRVAVGGRQYVQGAWLDWDALSRWLLESARDLLPEAELHPCADDSAAVDRRLASIPARLDPGSMATVAPLGPSALRLSLGTAWACFLLSVGAFAILLFGAVALGERRGAFASAVTHELRTPLTTFRLYTEMLDEGMVDDEKRRAYVRTLRNEADRLGHLVENVLAYARLERGTETNGSEPVRVGDLLDRVAGPLERRAEQSGMSLSVDLGEAERELRVRADPAAVEHILHNLVDNACKYASTARDRRIHLEARVENGRVCLRVRDHGEGVDRREARRLFRPFRKGRRHAADQAPGVGLGLALARRLARAMGADLDIDRAEASGATFVLAMCRVEPAPS